VTCHAEISLKIMLVEHKGHCQKWLDIDAKKELFSSEESSDALGSGSESRRPDGK
jgi:hypothetical protein